LIQHNFKLIIPVYNAEKYVNHCIASLKDQTYKNFQAIIINDCSTDKTLEVIQKYVGVDPRFIVKNNPHNMQALFNIFSGIKHICADDEDIICLIDGDDFLASNDVLEYLNTEVYRDEKILLSYGNYKTISNNQVGCCHPIQSTEHIREQPWCTSHLKTCKFELWKHLDEQDFKDDLGNFVNSSAWDNLIQFPLLEMATVDRIRCVNKILYCYNDLNPINEGKKDLKLQEEMAIYGRTKIRKYSPLNELLELKNLDEIEYDTTLLIQNKCNYAVNCDGIIFNAFETKEMPTSFRDKHTAVLKLIREVRKEKNVSKDSMVEYKPIEKDKDTYDLLYTFQYADKYIGNAIKRLKCSINSIKNQKVNIIVLNGSKHCIWDSIKDLCDMKYEHKYCQQYGAKCILINYGVKNLVNTEYFYLSDIDLIYQKNFVEYMLELKKQVMSNDLRPVRIVFSNYNLQENVYASDFNKLFNLRKRGIGLAHGNGMCHRPSFIKIRGMEENFIGYGTEDAEVNERIMRINNLIYDDNMATLHLYHERTNLMQEDKNMQIYKKTMHDLKSKLVLTIKDIQANKEKDWGII